MYHIYEESRNVLSLSRFLAWPLVQVFFKPAPDHLPYFLIPDLHGFEATKAKH